MKNKALSALNFINYLDYNNTQWGIIEDKDVRYFIAIEKPPYDELPGVWLYVWLKSGEADRFQCAAAIADKTIHIDEENETILLYRMES